MRILVFYVKLLMQALFFLLLSFLVWIMTIGIIEIITGSPPAYSISLNELAEDEKAIELLEKGYVLRLEDREANPKTVTLRPR